MEILALGQARSKFRLRIQILKVHLALHKEEKKNYLRKLLELGFLFKFFFFFLFFFFRAIPAAYGSSQARDRIRAAVASLHNNYSNIGFELLLQPMPQFVAMPDP